MLRVEAHLLKEKRSVKTFVLGEDEFMLSCSSELNLSDSKTHDEVVSSFTEGRLLKQICKQVAAEDVALESSEFDFLKHVFVGFIVAVEV